MQTTVPASRRARALAGIVLSLVLAASGAAILTPSAALSSDPLAVAPPLTVSSTATTAEAYMLSRLNRDRAARGLRALRLDPNLRNLARQRAANLVASRTFSHTAAGGDIGRALSRAGIQFYGAGEDIAWTSATWGTRAGTALYGLLRNSPKHWALMMSRDYNYVGIGVGERASDHRTFTSMMFTEARDHTPSTAKASRTSRASTTIVFHWDGRDPLLQTHTAGLRDFDVQYRVDDGAWVLVRNNTKSTGTTWTNRARGHTYWIRVRSRDRAGNVSAWSAPRGITVP